MALMAANPTRYSMEWREAARFLVFGAMIVLFICILAILYIDLPVALWIHRRGLDSHLWLRHLLTVPAVLAPVGGAYLLVYLARRLRYSPSRLEHAYFVIACGLLVTLSLKSMLKVAFGRTWPREVADLGSKVPVCDRPSLGYVNDGIHAFHAFGGSIKAYQAFPSGSTAMLLAVAVPVFGLHPKARPAVAVFVVVSLVAYVLTNTHFIADVVAGAYIGASVGLCALAITSSGRGIVTARSPG